MEQFFCTKEKNRVKTSLEQGNIHRCFSSVTAGTPGNVAGLGGRYDSFRWAER